MINKANKKYCLISLFIAITIIVSAFPVSAFGYSSTSNDTEEETNMLEEISEMSEDPEVSSKDSPESLELSSVDQNSRGTISSGVYAISMQNSTTYARCNTITGGTYLSRQTFSSAPAGKSVRHAMFKIIYRSSTDDYVIRLMTNNEVIVYANVGYNSPLSIRMQNKSDSSIPQEKTWKITTTTDGYYNISCTISGTTYYMCMPSSGSLSLTTDKNISGAKWNFHKYTGETFRGWGKIGEWPTHIENDSIATIEAYIYSTVLNEISAYFRSDVIDPDVATAARLHNTAQMTIVPRYGGNTKIMIEANVGSAVFGYDYLMSGWDTGSFFIKNKSNSQYLTQIDGESGEEVKLTSLPNGGDKEYTLWNMVYYADGYYQIFQDIVGDSLYGNDPVDSDLCGRPWVDPFQETLWKFIPQSDGTFKIQSQYHELNNPNHYVSLHNTSTKNIRSLEGTGDKQMWYIEPLKFNVEILYDYAFTSKYGSSEYLNVLNHVFGENSIGYSIPEALYDRLGMRMTIKYVSTSSNTFRSNPYEKTCLKSSSTYIDDFCLNHYDDFDDYTCNITGQSTLQDDCNNGKHHKQWQQFDDNLPSSDSYIPILFTGHKACGVNGVTSEHEEAKVAGYANYRGGTSITILGQAETDLTGDLSAVLLLHEIMHILNSPHDMESTDEDRKNCLMGANCKSAVIKQNLMMCDHCVSIMDEYKYTFYNH